MCVSVCVHMCICTYMSTNLFQYIFIMISLLLFFQFSEGKEFLPQVSELIIHQGEIANQKVLRRILPSRVSLQQDQKVSREYPSIFCWFPAGTRSEFLTRGRNFFSYFPTDLITLLIKPLRKGNGIKFALSVARI